MGAARSAIESRRSAWAFNPSASIKSGASIRRATARASSSESSSRPSPGPRTTAAARSAASRIASAELAAKRPSAPPNPRDITSVSFTSKIASRSAGTATVA